MELVFIHGFGFDASVWDPLFELLPQFKKRRIDLGFFGAAAEPLRLEGPSVLVGHSLGFLHGLRDAKKLDPLDIHQRLCPICQNRDAAGTA